MRDCVKLTLILSIALSLSGCASAPPEPPSTTMCSIYRPGIAECEPEDKRKASYDLDLNSIDALGAKVIPPEDYAKLYIWLEELLEWIRTNIKSRRK